MIGVKTVINLALPTSDHALSDERAVVESAGMNYVHIPVVFEVPTQADFEQFCTAMDAAKALEADGVQAEVIDLRSLAPLDREAILTSVAKTSRALLLYEATRTGGIGGELAAIIAEEAFEYLDAPIMRIASQDAPVPYAPQLESAFLPSVDKVVAGAKRLVEY